MQYRCRTLHALALLALILSADLMSRTASAADASVNLAGVGGRSCSYWMSSRERKLEGTVWIYGFWTGLNYVAVSSEQNQSGLNEDAMVAAVERTCRRQPSQVLGVAAWVAYLEDSAKSSPSKP